MEEIAAVCTRDTEDRPRNVWGSERRAEDNMEDESSDVDERKVGHGYILCKAPVGPCLPRPPSHNHTPPDPTGNASVAERIFRRGPWQTSLKSADASRRVEPQPTSTA